MRLSLRDPRLLGLSLLCCCLTLAYATWSSAPARAALSTSYLRQIGSLEGLGNGDVAVNDVSGDLYVARTVSGRGVVEVFDSLGTHLLTWEGTNTPAGGFAAGPAVAVNDTSGDVYVTDTGNRVVDAFDANGNYLFQIDGATTPAKSFGAWGPQPLAVDQSDGDLYVPDPSNNELDVFSSAGSYLRQIYVREAGEKPLGSTVAVDSAANAVFVAESINRGGVVYKYELSSGRLLAAWEGTSPQQSFGALVSVALDEATGDVLVASANEGKDEVGPTVVDVFDPAGDYLSPQIIGTPSGPFPIPSELLGPPLGLAVNSASGEILVSDQIESAVDIFSSTVVPGVMVSSPGGLRADGAALSLQGAINPDGVRVSACRFEYQTEAAFESAKSAEAAARQAAREARTAASTEAQAAAAAKANAEKLEAEGRKELAGEERQRQQAEETRAKAEEKRAGEEEAAAAAQREGWPSAGSAECAQTAQVGEGHSDVSVSAAISGLDPDTAYAYRLVATNANGTNDGQAASFFTSTAPLIEGERTTALGSSEATVEAQIDPAGLASDYVVEYGPSSEAGYSSATAEASAGNGQQPRSAVVRIGGLQPSTSYHYRFVATNALGVTRGPEQSLSTYAFAGASSSALPDHRTLELVTSHNEDNDAYVPGLQGENTETYRTVAPAADGDALAYIGDPTPGGNGGVGNGFGNQFLASRGAAGGWSSKIIAPEGVNFKTGAYQGFSEDLGVGVLLSRRDYPLTPDASTACNTLYSYTAATGQYRALFTGTRSAGEKCEGAAFSGTSAGGAHILFEMPASLTPQAPGGEQENLYDYSGEKLSLVNVLPDGTPAASSAFGSPNEPLKSHVVSGDGSRAFWTDQSTHDLYVREGSGTAQASTTLISEGGEYVTASGDGSLAIFTKGGDPYSYAVGTATTRDLASGAGLLGVVGASADANYVYFVGRAALAGAGGVLKNAAGEEPQAGQSNLYLAHGQEVQFLATLAESDSSDWTRSVWSEGFAGVGANVFTTAEVAASGNALVFLSHRNLTAYDSHGAEEVYVYESGGGVRCISCNRTGAAPTGSSGLSYPTGHTQLPAWINQSGTEVFFDSSEPLTPQETGGKTQVYEWESDGAGGCAEAEGCLGVLSAGAVGQEANFLGASANGNDVFFATRAQLLIEDESDNTVVYDARANAKPITPPLCTGTGCQGVPGAPPIFATPASVTYNGVGNFEPAPATAAKPKPKSKSVRCRRGVALEKGRCVKKAKSKRRKSAARRKRSKRGNR